MWTTFSTWGQKERSDSSAFDEKTGTTIAVRLQKAYPHDRDSTSLNFTKLSLIIFIDHL